jgi:MFS family permease
MTHAACYLTSTYAVERRKSLGGEGGAAFLLVNTLVLFLVVLPCKPLGGSLSDKVGRRKLMMTITAAMMALICLSLRLMLYGSPQAFAAGQIRLAGPSARCWGCRARWSSRPSRCAPA